MKWHSWYMVEGCVCVCVFLGGLDSVGVVSCIYLVFLEDMSTSKLWIEHYGQIVF